METVAATGNFKSPQPTEITREEIAAKTKERTDAQMSAQHKAAKEFDVGINLDIDVNARITSITDAINAAINGNQEREAFVKTLLETVTSNINGSHNIMIFNMQQGFDFNPDWQWTWFTSDSYQGIVFGIWVFRGPTQFVNQGDGGWINWGFYGSFNRDGGTVVFNQL
jgi:hypothetical protein